MFENSRRGRQARNFTTNVPKILDLKSSSEQIFSRKLPLGAPDIMMSAGWSNERTFQQYYHKPAESEFNFDEIILKSFATK